MLSMIFYNSIMKRGWNLAGQDAHSCTALSWSKVGITRQGEHATSREFCKGLCVDFQIQKKVKCHLPDY